MQRVTGIGGVFFKSKDPEKLGAWYEKHLGVKAAFNWRDDHGGDGTTAWAIFPADTKYFHPSQSSFMINFRVADLDALLELLRQEGVEVDERREDYDYGRFAWIMDPDGNRVELWEPR